MYIQFKQNTYIPIQSNISIPYVTANFQMFYDLNFLKNKKENRTLKKKNLNNLF